MASPRSIRSITAIGLHGHQDLSIKFRDGLNIVYGTNGSGKTTLLHIIANLLHKDLDRFRQIRFQEIIVTSDHGHIRLTQTADGPDPFVEVTINGRHRTIVLDGFESNEVLNHEIENAFGPAPVYLPAFRSVLDATENVIDMQRGPNSLFERSGEDTAKLVERIRQEYKTGYAAAADRGVQDRSFRTACKTILCRQWFGSFVPIIKYPALWEIAKEIQVEIENAHLDLARTDQGILSGIFITALKSIATPNTRSDQSKTLPELIVSVRNELTELMRQQNAMSGVYSRLIDILNDLDPKDDSSRDFSALLLSIYHDALRDRARKRSEVFEQLTRFVASVNSFWQGKKLILPDRTSPRLVRSMQLIELRDSKRRPLEVLSSGERHVLTLLFSATHMSAGDGIVLIDEPELSLHIDWQRIMLGELTKQASGRQVIACTHSPEVAAEHRDRLLRLQAIEHLPSSGDAGANDERN